LSNDFFPGRKNDHFTIGKLNFLIFNVFNNLIFCCRILEELPAADIRNSINIKISSLFRDLPLEKIALKSPQEKKAMRAILSEDLNNHIGEYGPMSDFLPWNER